jgi:hypothetical protein
VIDTEGDGDISKVCDCAARCLPLVIEMAAGDDLSALDLVVVGEQVERHDPTGAESEADATMKTAAHWNRKGSAVS